jgi:hypothetical protein
LTYEFFDQNNMAFFSLGDFVRFRIIFNFGGSGQKTKIK